MSNSFFMPFKVLIYVIIFIILFISIFFIPCFPNYSFSNSIDNNFTIDISKSGYAWPSPRVYYYKFIFWL